MPSENKVLERSLGLELGPLRSKSPFCTSPEVGGSTFAVQGCLRILDDSGSNGFQGDHTSEV